MHVTGEIRTVQTNWYVITGAPCSGKTTVINALAAAGYTTVSEVARAYIDRRLANGETIASIKSDPLAFERHILLEKCRIEHRMSKEKLIVFDRAVPDSIAYFQLEGLAIEEPLAHSYEVRYKNVFLFEPLTFEPDAVRSENQSVAARIENLIDQAYSRLGYALIRVPKLSIQRRLDFVMAHLEGRAAP